MVPATKVVILIGVKNWDTAMVLMIDSEAQKGKH